MNARVLSLLCAAASAWSGPAAAQRADRLGPQVRKYLRVDTPEVILEHVEVIDGTGAAPLADRNVRISAGKIAAIMPGADELPRDGATILDLRGRSVLPGIVGMHDHLFYLAQPDPRPDGSLERPAFFVETRFSAPRLYLANGVTTIRTAGAVEPETDLKIRDDIERGVVPGPHLHVTGPYLDGGDFTLEHMAPGSPQAEQLISTLIRHRVAITSTLVSTAASVADRRTPLRAAVLEAMAPHLREAYDVWRGRPVSPGNGALLRREMELERAFVAAGGLLLAGPDPVGIGGNLFGFGDQRQLELLVEAGFAPLEAIRIATLNGASFLGVQDRIGSIAVGKIADLVVVKGDPATRIADVENVEIVFRDGAGYDPKKLLDSVKGSYGEY
jgi:imidazolonepropionase-like amidohydrolase